MFWTPVEFRPQLEADIANLKSRDQNFIPPKIIEISNTNLRPPTYFKTNPFTASFQMIVDTYGVPRYKECNPGLFTVVSFPFLFGLMFGDAGHGLCITIMGLMLVFY